LIEQFFQFIRRQRMLYIIDALKFYSLSGQDTLDFTTCGSGGLLVKCDLLTHGYYCS
jgi:hypothetical protein